MGRNWNEFDRFSILINKYMPESGEGDTMASQICTAVNKLVYKWYNDGDVYDNTNGYLEGWCNDLSSYANWLRLYCCGDLILDQIYECKSRNEYENLLYKIAEAYIEEEYLNDMADHVSHGSIYECDGPFEFIDHSDEDEDYDPWLWEDEEDE